MAQCTWDTTIQGSQASRLEPIKARILELWYDPEEKLFFQEGWNQSAYVSQLEPVPEEIWELYPLPAF
jgi:hypothetical protein